MIQILFNLFVIVLRVLYNVLFVPLNNAIDLVMPNLGNFLSFVSNFFSHIAQYSKFILSWFGMYDSVVRIIVALFVTTIVVPLTAHTLKLVLKWWEVLT